MAIDTNRLQQQAADLSSQLWSIANDLRGGMDANEFRNYILGTIFYRYLSERTEMYMEEILKEDGLPYEEAFSNADFKPIVEQWSLEHLGYIIKPENLFRELNRRIIKPKNDEDKFSVEDYERAVNELTGSTLGNKSEKAFEGLFNDMRLQDTRLGDTVSERTEKIGKVISKIGEIDMNLQDQQFDVLGTAYMILIGLFQSGAGKKGGEFFTPTGPSKLCATLATLGLDEAKTVGDCTCGNASDGFAGRAASTAAVVPEPVLEVVAQVGMTRAVPFLDFGVVVAALVFVKDGERNRGSGGFAFENARKDLDLVLFVAGGGHFALPGAAAVEFRLDFFFGDFEACRAAIQDRADGRTMGFAPGSNAKNFAKSACHESKYR